MAGSGTDREGRAVGVTIAAGLVIGFVWPYLVARWGFGPTWGFVGGILTTLAFFGVAFEISESHARKLKTLAAFVVAAIAGFLLGVAMTYRPMTLEQVEETRPVPYDRNEEFKWDVWLTGAAECQPDQIDLWGARRYQFGETIGWDVIGWSGTRRDLNEVGGTTGFSESFRQVNMDDPSILSGRRPLGVACIEGEAVPWGLDNYPDNKVRAVAWSTEGGGWVRAPGAESEHIASVLQERTGGIATVLWGSDSATRGIRCKAIASGLTPATMVDSKNTTELLKLERRDALLDAAVRDGIIYLLLLREVEGEPGRGHLELARARSDCKEWYGSSVLVRGSDAVTGVLNMGYDISVGPEGYLALSSGESLRIEIYQQNKSVGYFEIDAGYDPKRAGVFELTPADREDEMLVLGWAYPEDGELGDRANENVISVLRWRERGTVCVAIGAPHSCLPEDEGA